MSLPSQHTAVNAMKSFSLLLVVLLLAQTPAPRNQPQTAGPLHRLDPLSAAEITLVTDAVAKAGRMSASVRVVTIELAEPDKAARAQTRVGRAVLYDWSSGVTTEMTVDLQSRAVSAPATIATGDPPVRRVVIDRATEIALGDQRVVQALARHGIKDLSESTSSWAGDRGCRAAGRPFRSSFRRSSGIQSAMARKFAGSPSASISPVV